VRLGAEVLTVTPDTVALGPRTLSVLDDPAGVGVQVMTDEPDPYVFCPVPPKSAASASRLPSQVLTSKMLPTAPAWSESNPSFPVAK
jgi:hypothetical protein